MRATQTKGTRQNDKETKKIFVILLNCVFLVFVFLCFVLFFAKNLVVSHGFLMENFSILTAEDFFSPHYS